MATYNELHRFSHGLSLLYVEDNPIVRDETSRIFSMLFKKVTIAEDGEKGLEKYNIERFDLVITDINMPNLNGIEMIKRIREINPEQKIVAISAYDDTPILIDLIRKGVSSFILKPLNLDEVINILYPVCRDADTQNVNSELFNTLQNERNNLKKVVKALKAHLNTVEIKNNQINMLYDKQEALEHPAAPKKEESEKSSEKSDQYMAEYFAKDEATVDEEVLFMREDTDEIRDLLNALPDQLSLYCMEKNTDYIDAVQKTIGGISRILYHYTPFLDPLAQNLETLAICVRDQKEFVDLLDSKPDQVMALFDAICIDLGLYVERFTRESMAMHNIHHIHLPTTISIQQIIHMIVPPDNDDSGDLEFF